MRRWILCLVLSLGLCLSGCLVIEEDVHDDYDDYDDDGLEVEIDS